MVGEPVRRVGEASNVHRRRGVGNSLVLNARPTARANGSQGERPRSSGVVASVTSSQSVRIDVECIFSLVSSVPAAAMA
jgi:hypothetical protein